MPLLSEKQRVLQKAIFMVLDLGKFLNLEDPVQPEVPLSDYTEDQLLTVVKNLTVVLRQFDNLVKEKGECRCCKRAHKLAAKKELTGLIKSMGKQLCLISGISYSSLVAELVEEKRRTGKARSRTMGPRGRINITKNNYATSPLLPNATNDRSPL